MPDNKTKSEDFPAQADKQAATNTAVHEGKDGAQASAINKDQVEKGADKGKSG